MRKYSLITAKQGKKTVAALYPIGADEDPAAVYVASEVDEHIKDLKERLFNLVAAVAMHEEPAGKGLTQYHPAVMDARAVLGMLRSSASN